MLRSTSETHGVLDMQSLVKELFSVIPGSEKAVPLPTVDADSLSEREFARNWVDKNKACLIKGAVKHWPAVRKWARRDYWSCIPQDCKVPVYLHMNHNHSDRDKMEGGNPMPFEKAMEWLFQGGADIVSIPIGQSTFEEHFSVVTQDMPGFGFLPFPKMPVGYARRRMIMYRCAGTSWHYHGVDETLMCQVKGTKRVGLLPPDIPKPKYVSEFLNLERNLDGEVLDQSLDLKMMIADVEEGDALYIPPYWYHGVMPVRDEVGFTLAYCWRSPIHILGNFSNYFVRKIHKRFMRTAKGINFSYPFVASYAGCAYLIKKLRGQA